MDINLTDHHLELILTLVSNAQATETRSPEMQWLIDLENIVWDKLQDGAPNPWAERK